MSDITSDDISQFTDHTGVVRNLTGMAPVPDNLVGAFVRYGDSNALIDESTITPFDLPAPFPTFDQGQTSSCNAHSGTEGIMLSLYCQGTQPVPRLDPWSFYALMCNGRPIGTSIADALDLLQSWGMATWGTITPGTYNPKTIPATNDAAAHKLDSGQMLTTREEIVTAIARQQPLNAAVCVGRAFEQGLDSRGVVTLGNRACNHSITIWGGYRLNPQTNAAEVKALNHWGTDWGLNGWFWIPLDDLADARSFQCYEVKAAIFDPNGPVKIPQE